MIDLNLELSKINVKRKKMSQKNSSINKSIFAFVKSFVCEKNKTDTNQENSSTTETITGENENVVEVNVTKETLKKVIDDSQSGASNQASYLSPISSSDEKELNSNTNQIKISNELELEVTETFRLEKVI